MGWDPTDFSTWSGLDEAIHQIGMVLWVVVATRYSLHDTTVAIAGVTSIMLWSITLSCITDGATWWLVIIASLLGMLEASIEPALRTLITSLSIGQETGRLLALLGLLESIWLTVDRSIFTYLYNTFVADLPQVSIAVM
jgi:MFS transporter, PCFT/HCP family, solute carrier family 46, member 3